MTALSKVPGIVKCHSKATIHVHSRLSFLFLFSSMFFRGFHGYRGHHMKYRDEHATFVCNMLHFKSMPILVTSLLALLLSYSATAFAQQLAETTKPTFIFPRAAITAQELGVIVNDDDPLSVQIGAYYQKARRIPEENMIHIRFQPHNNLTPKKFTRLKAEVDAATPTDVQAYALTWVSPWKVGCMSVTSAFTFGYDEAYCARGCKTTKTSTYFNHNTHQPFRELGIRPTMAIAAASFEQAKQLIDRGIAADFSHPQGKGYLLSTSDKARNSRAQLFPYILQQLQHGYPLQQVDADYLEGKDDILFYFTGLVKVPALESNHFLPGAIADHLTSTGGMLTGSKQMSSLRWLEAGATGSYGTVVEPCNFVQKFPHPGIVIGRYLTGESLLEAYWKSVAQPGQGIFIGEPLTTPFGGVAYKWDQNTLLLRTRSLAPGAYLLLSAEQRQGPFTPERKFLIHRLGVQEMRLEELTKPVYTLMRIPPAAESAPGASTPAPTPQQP